MNKMRIYHRYLGFFLAGIMAMYGISGIILIFRDTDFLKFEKEIESKLAPQLSDEQIGKELRIRDFKVERVEGNLAYFNTGTYDKSNGIAKHKVKELPFVIDKMTHLHKADTKSPLFFLNIFFGTSLLFFVVSAFWMFLPSTDVFRKGMLFVLAGVILTLIALFV
ncbi:MAG: hypothetical protein ABIS36_12205 [Chryseolinea sp.]